MTSMSSVAATAMLKSLYVKFKESKDILELENK